MELVFYRLASVHPVLPSALHGCNVTPFLGQSVEAAESIRDTIVVFYATDDVYVETNYCSALASLPACWINLFYLKQQEIICYSKVNRFIKSVCLSVSSTNNF
jgi:hypothetical protein